MPISRFYSPNIAGLSNFYYRLGTPRAGTTRRQRDARRARHQIDCAIPIATSFMRKVSYFDKASEPDTISFSIALFKLSDMLRAPILLEELFRYQPRKLAICQSILPLILNLRRDFGLVIGLLRYHGIGHRQWGRAAEVSAAAARMPIQISQFLASREFTGRAASRARRARYRLSAGCRL